MDLDGLAVQGSGVEIFNNLDDKFFAARLTTEESTQLYIFMPDKTIPFAQFVKRIGSQFLETVSGKFEKCYESILIPKILKKSFISLKQKLQPSLLETVSKSNSTDFSGINAKYNLHLSDLLQISQFELPDSSVGKSTSIFWRRNIDNDQKYAVQFNRPFVFLVKSSYMDLILHIGSFTY